MSQYYDRYNKFRINGKMLTVPGLTIPELPTDKYVVYKQGVDRLDKLSNTYYLNPYNGWLIMLANPQLGGLEFNIVGSVSIRIPYPLDSGINRYINEITTYKLLYGE